MPLPDMSLDFDDLVTPKAPQTSVEGPADAAANASQVVEETPEAPETPSEDLMTPTRHPMAPLDEKEALEANEAVSADTADPSPCAQGPVDSDGLLDGDLPGTAMTRREQSATVARSWLQQVFASICEGVTNPSGVCAGAFTGRPESFAEYRAYIKARGWLPDGVDDKWIEKVPLVYYNSIGLFGIVTGRAWAWMFARMIRFIITMMTIIIVVILWNIF